MQHFIAYLSSVISLSSMMSMIYTVMHSQFEVWHDKICIEMYDSLKILTNDELTS